MKKLFRKPRRGQSVAPLAENTTPYGGQRFRKAWSKNSYVYPAGSKPQAVILDIDGTLMDWGSGPSKKVLEWCDKHDKAGRVLVVITARTHDYDYDRSFNWLVRHLPYPFIGPFHRSADDPRYASEFKREVAEALSQLYTIVGAADDNRFVNDMWKHWAALHPEVDFDHLECGYTPYADWRKDLPATKSYNGSYTGGYGYTQGAWGTRDDYGWNSYDAWESTRAPATSRGTQDTHDEVQGALARMEGYSDADIERWELEEEVYAHSDELTRADIEAMDIEVLKAVAARYDQPETAPLDVVEIFADCEQLSFNPEEVVQGALARIEGLRLMVAAAVRSS